MDEDHLEATHQNMIAWADRARLAETRIAELEERERTICGNLDEEGACKKCGFDIVQFAYCPEYDRRSYITYAQLKAMCKYYDHAETASLDDENGDYWMEFVDGILRTLGIERCGKCHGEGVTKRPVPTSMYPDSIVECTCPGCNGKGWVKHE